jgi:hypothetical protein
MSIRSFFLLLCVASIVRGATPLPDDKMLTSLLIGAWSLDPPRESATTSESSYRADGSCTEVIWKRDKAKGSGVEVTGRWQIKDGALNLTTVASTDPKWIAVGLAIEYQIVSLSDSRLVIEHYYTPDHKHSFQAILIRKKEPNQPSELTPPAVTPRADARGAPAGGVAHL